MLPASSVLFVALVLIAPITIAAALMCLLLHILGKEAYSRPASIFLCVAYILILMLKPVSELSTVAGLLNSLDGKTLNAVTLAYLVIPAALMGYIFRDNIGKFAIVLGAMTLASFAGNLNLLLSELTGKDRSFGLEMAESLQDITLARTPNIYLIISDGYGSFAYMEEHGIDVGRFRNFLTSDGFQLYDEAFSNYHSTAESLPAILNMDHHYYALSHSHKSSEVRKTGRIIVGGENNIADLMRRNSYQVQYIHNWPYMLLHGCTADHCYGEMPLAGAKIVLGELSPFKGTRAFLDQIWAKYMQDGQTKDKDYFLERSSPMLSYGIRNSLDGSRREVARLIEENATADPLFQYIHLFAPTHAPDSQVGICDESEQIDYYSERVAEVNIHLQNLVTDIIARDPAAVIVITSDHGPFIADKCSRWTDLDTLSGYRDRMGVIMAIRWPEGYDGRYDEKIITPINVFKYVIATLANNDADILETVVCEDVFIVGSKNVLEILDDGNIRIPPKQYTVEALQTKRHQPCQKSAY